MHFCVVPLAIDLILGLPWLCLVQPSIDWGLYHGLWDHYGNVVEVYGCGGEQCDLYNCTLTLPSWYTISSKHLFYGLSRGHYAGGALHGLVQTLLNAYAQHSIVTHPHYSYVHLYCIYHWY